MTLYMTLYQIAFLAFILGIIIYGYTCGCTHVVGY